METVLTYINGIAIRRNFVDHLPYNPHLKILLKEKRKAGILSEVLFWKQVRARTFHRIDFDRQRVIGNYIVDFYVKALGLVVEIEGNSGIVGCDEDHKKKFLESFGLKVFIVSDFDMRKNLPKVMLDLENFIIFHFGNHPVF